MKLNKIDKSYFINLNRRTDRLNHIYKTLPFYANKSQAVDSRTLNLTDEVLELFPETYHSLSKPEICCALSHYKLWQQLILDEKCESYLIMEDDVVFSPGFANFWNKAFSEHIPLDFSLIYLGGCQPWNKSQYNKVLKSRNKYFNNIKENNFFFKGDYYWHMNASSYIISKKAATQLCNEVSKSGINSAIDLFMINTINSIDDKSLYHLHPLMSHQIHEEGNNSGPDTNSDIRESVDKFNKIQKQDSIKNQIFPNLKPISSSEIPKKIHLSWSNKNILDSDYSLINKGAKQLELLNPNWDIEVYDDEDINRLLRDSIGIDNWNLIKDKKITEKTDLWRLIKTYKEGGLYVDIDRYIDTPLSEIMNDKTSCVLPTYKDIDFSQDFVLTCPKNPIIGQAIVNNLKYRKQGKSLFFIAVYSYIESVSGVLGRKIIDRIDRPDYFNKVRSDISQCPYLETYRETGPDNHALFRNINNNFNIENFNNDKADLYNSSGVPHWNADTRSQFVSSKLKKESSIKLKQEEFINIKDSLASFVDYDIFNHFSKNLKHKKTTNDKFSTFNPGKKIAIVSLYTPDTSDYSKHSEESIKQYCFLQGYTFHMYRDSIKKDCSPNWSKAQAVLNHILDHDYIMWMDSDTLIFNPNKRIESIIDKCTKMKQIIACKDIGVNGSMINSGVIIFKNHNYTVNILKRWNNYNGDKSSLYSDGGDQEVLCSIIKKSDPFKYNIKIFPMNEFNTEPRLVDKDTFILHFMAFPEKLKICLMSYWNC